MAKSEHDGLIGEQSIGGKLQNEPDRYEDEIDLTNHFVIVWKHRYFIFLATVLPAIITGFYLFFGPRYYTINFTYNMELDKKAFQVLEDTFYGGANIEILVKRLREANLEEPAVRLVKAQTSNDLKNIVSFVILPTYFENAKISGAKIDELQKLQQVKGTLLIMQVKAQSEKYTQESAAIFRNNFEEIIPLCEERENLNHNIITFRESMASIEEKKYILKLQLETKKMSLEKLKKIVSEGPEKLPGDNIILQFNNIENTSAYLPLHYQIQAEESQIITLEEIIKTNEELYRYYTDLLKLNEKLFIHVSKTIPFDFTFEQFCSFLTETSAEYKDHEQVVDYLNAYIKRIENRIATSLPVVEKPNVYPISRGTVKKCGVVFTAAFILSVLMTFLREGFAKNKNRILQAS